MNNKIVIIGGTNIDIVAQTKDHLILHDSNPGSITYSFGGVANNIAQNLNKLNLDVTFLTVVGKDQFGLEYLDFARNANINLIIKQSVITPTYLAVINHEHDLEVAVAAMDSLSLLDVEFIKTNHNILEQAALIVCDTNLDSQTLKYIFETYSHKEIYVEAVSTFKVMKILPYLDKISHLKVNFKEALAISNLTKDASLDEINGFFERSKVKHLYITDGAKGSYYKTKNRHSYLVSEPTEIKNTSGAGDSFFSGVIYANINNLDPLVVGNKMAKITLESNFSVSEKLNEKYLLTNIKRRKR